MRNRPRIIEYIFTVVSLLFYSGNPLAVILSGGHSEGLETVQHDFALARLCFLLIYIITFLYLLPSWKRAAYLLIKDKWILFLMIITFFSMFWSVDMDRTITRTIAIFGTTLFGIYFATRYSLKQQLYLLGITFGLVIVMSLFFVVALPQYGIMQGVHAGSWRGIYTHKNGLGGVMSLSTITFLILNSFDKKNNRILIIGIIASVFLLLLSTSSSPLAYLMVLLPILFIARSLKWTYRSKMLAISFSTTLGYVLVLLGLYQAESIANAFGKDLTFTGRTDLWFYAWELIQKKPWLGYGYSALWASVYSETGRIWRILGWEAPHAHNGFLEVWLGLGILGLLVLMIHIVTSFVRVLSLISYTKASVYFFPFMVLLIVFSRNLTEYTFMERNNIDWVLYVAAALSLQTKANISSENTLFLTPSSFVPHT